MQKILTLSLLVAIIFLTNRLAEAEGTSAFVSIEGKQFIGPDGKPFLLKGMSFGNWLLPEGYLCRLDDFPGQRQINEGICQLIGPDEARKFWQQFRENYITQDDIQFLKRAGFNSVRIPFDYRLFVVDGDAPLFEGPGYALMDRVVGWCRAVGLYVILDMHAAPGGQTGINIDNSYGYPCLYEGPAYQQLTVELWKRLADRYKDERTVLGYDLLNEPIANDFEKFNPMLEPLYKRITSAIRTVDKNHIVFLGGAQWDTNFNVFGPPFDKKSAYTFHMYLDQPTKATFQRFLDFSSRYNVPIWLGESGETYDEWIMQYRTALEGSGVGWCFWPYKKLEVPGDHGRVHPYGSCVVTVTPPADWQKVSAYFALPRTSWEEIHAKHLPVEEARKIFAELIENIQFKKCKVQDGYTKALGLKPTE